MQNTLTAPSNSADTAPRNPAGHAPVRRPGSIRRTSSIETTWPDGQGTPMHMTGRARDMLTPADGSAPRVLDEGAFQIVASAKREILSIATTPEIPGLQRLVGERAGGYLRTHMAEIIPDVKAAGTPLYLILDDYSGASLVSGWAWSRWTDNWIERMREAAIAAGQPAMEKRRMEGVCTGFRPGSTALRSDGASEPTTQSSTQVVSLVNPDDPPGWHELTEQTGVGFRRARRIDIWRDGADVRLNVGFQDTSTSPAGGRVAIHEYVVDAVADARTLELKYVHADPRVLPYRECPTAQGLAQRIVGSHMGQLRERVLELLPGILGCTHLNDVLRSMAETPQLLAALDRA
jgi:hypothetical protein